MKILTLLLGILFQFIVFIFDLGAGISCWGNFSITASVSILFGVEWTVLLCKGGGGAGTKCVLLGGPGTFGGGGGGGGNAGPKNQILQIKNIALSEKKIRFM